MKTTRRTFAKQVACGAGAASLLRASALAKDTQPNDEALEQAVLDRILAYEVRKIPRVCHECEGKGWHLRSIIPFHAGRREQIIDCPGCNGTGVTWLEVRG